MSFNDQVPNHLAELKKKRLDLVREKLGMMHDCDCNFCDYDGVEDEERFEKIEKEIEDIDRNIERLKKWAKDHDLPLVKEGVAA